MARRLFEFQCVGEEHHIFEKFCDETLKTAICPECGELSNRIISAVRFDLEPFSGAFPGAYAAWNRKRAEKMKQEQKKNS